METSTVRLVGAETDDRISGLPDDLLLDILLRLRCTKAAARTSALSRRWRAVWTRLPDVYLWSLRPVLPASCVSIVGAALAASSAPTLRRLVIRVDDSNLLNREGVTAVHVAPWLRFASGRVAGELFLWLPTDTDVLATGSTVRQPQDLGLPVFAAARGIQIRLRGSFRLRPPADGGGAFAALTCLGIHDGMMDGGELGGLVSSSACPCLEELSLTVRLAAADSDVSIRSGSLKRLRFHVGNTRRLVVEAPELREICASKAVEARIAAPKLEDVDLRDDDNGRYEIAEAGRHVQRLVVDLRFPLPAILRRFDTVGELIINRLLIPEYEEGYETFTDELRRLDCEALVLRSIWTTFHNSLASMLHLLRVCSNSLKKFVVNLRWSSEGSSFCLPDCCACTWPESFRNDNIQLDSLEKVEVNGFTGKDRQLECVKLLLRCNAPMLKGVVFCLSPHDFPKFTDIIQDEIRGMLPPDIELRACLEPCRSFGILEELNLYA